MAEESISDEVLGELKLEDGYWIGETEIRPDHVVGISLSFDEDDVAPLLVQSRSILKLLRQDEIEYRRGIADRMLELYNETWSDGEKIAGPLSFSFNNPLAASAMSRTISPSTR